jgi:hypothetical protein
MEDVQSTVGDVKRTKHSAEIICECEITTRLGYNRGAGRLAGAILEAWDGSPEHARNLECTLLPSSRSFYNDNKLQAPAAKR